MLERFAVKALYRKLKFVLEQPSTSLPFNTRSLTGTFVHFINVGVLKRRCFRKYLEKEKAQSLLCKVDEHNTLRENWIQRLIEEAEAQKPHDGQPLNDDRRVPRL